MTNLRGYPEDPRGSLSNGELPIPLPHDATAYCNIRTRGGYAIVEKAVDLDEYLKADRCIETSSVAAAVPTFRYGIPSEGPANRLFMQLWPEYSSLPCIIVLE